MDWFTGILLLILGACIGGMITLKCLEKSTNELIESYDNLVGTQKSMMELDDKLIGAYRKLILNTYNHLVHVKNGDTDDIDVVIDKLSEVIGNTTVKEPETDKEE